MRAARRGEEHAVRVVGPAASRKAARLAKLAHEGEDIVRHDAHIPEGDPHYQPKKGSGGHVGYDVGVFIAGLIPVVGWFADADELNAQEDVRMEQVRANMIALEDYGKPFDRLTPDEKQKVWAEATGQQPREAPPGKKKDDPDAPDPNNPKRPPPDKWQY
jgi:hypothetical protein